MRSILRLFLVAGLGLATGSAKADDASKGLLVAPVSADSTIDRFRHLRKHALIIGINEYDNNLQGIANLRFAVRDARAVHEALVDPARGAFASGDTQLLCDDCDEKPTSTNIGKALAKLIIRAREDDLVVIFFSGHGLEEGGRSYLLPRNADLDALDYTSLERDTFIRQIDKLRARRVVVVLDACHSGGVSRGGKAAGRDATLTGQYYEQFAKSQGRAFIASCSGGELSWEDEKAQQGVFSGALVRGLSGRADDGPKDGLVSLSELRRYVEAEVNDWAKSFGKVQRPQATLEASFGDIPMALNGDYLATQSERREARSREARELRTRIIQARGLNATEIAQAIALTDRYEQGDSLTSKDDQNLDFLRNFVGGSISLKMYRAGITPDAAPGIEAMASRRPGRWSLSIAGGVSSVGGDALKRTVGFAPAVGIGVAIKRRLGLQLQYQSFSFELQPTAPSTVRRTRSGNLIALGPRYRLSMGTGPRTELLLGVGTFMGSDITGDETNIAGTGQVRVSVPFGTNTSLQIGVGGVMGRARTIDPDERRIRACLVAAVGLGLSN